MAAEHPWRGTGAIVAAFVIWGVVPLYWKAVGAIPAREMIAYRLLWAIPFLALLMHWSHAQGSLRRVVADRRLLGMLCFSAALIGSNWYVFITAILDGRVLQASLGYYINPLMNVLLGCWVLREQLRKIQWLAVALAALGVLNLVVQVGELPWVALFLGASFALYGLVRKTVRVDALPGLFVEVLLLAPLGVALLVVLFVRGEARLAEASLGLHALVPLAGLITALPLWLFSYGARRLRLVTVGLAQFIAPTGQFALAVFAFNEPFTTAHAVTFALIWAGVVLYLIDLARRRAHLQVRASADGRR